jgi:N4-gp56 family major capsid protein
MNPKTQFLTDNALTRKRWAKDLFKIILPAIEYNDLVGTGTDAIVQMRTELGKGQGDTITFGIRYPLSGEGVVGNDDITGKEERLIFKDFDMTIEELNHAVDTGGKMEEQRIPYNLMTEAKDGLSDWWSDKLSEMIINHLAGVSSFRVAGKTFGQNPSEPDSDHAMTVNDVAEASLTSADALDLSFLDRMKQRAELPTGDALKIRPLKKGGKKYFRVILHNYVFDMLRQNTNVGQWGDLLRSANRLQVPNVEIEYNGMLISKSERVPEVYDNVYRNLLLGCQAACIAWGGAGDSKGTTMSFHPYTRDADRFLMVRGGGILGVKKVVFNSLDYGVITGSSYATALG